MKSNIDLTTNRDFNKDNHRNDFEMDLVAEMIGTLEADGTIHEITSEMDFYKLPKVIKDGEELFYTGSAKEIRETKKFCKNYTPTIHCDRCGKKLVFNIFSNTLCLECTKELEHYFGTYGWGNYNVDNKPKDWLALRMRKINF